MEQACQAVMEHPTKHNLVECWSLVTAMEAQRVENGLSVLGLIFRPVQSLDRKEACVALNHFLRDRFQGGKWTLLAVILNSRIGLHCNMGNMIGMPNHAIALGNFTGGQVWVEDDEGMLPNKVVIEKQNLSASRLGARYA